MSDATGLVEDLRAQARGGEWVDGPAALMEAAADRIEVLEAALRPFAAIGLDPADDDNQGYEAVPVRGRSASRAEFTAGDVRRARSEQVDA